MNDIQQHVRQQVNDAFAIASDHVREDGTVEFVCDDGDTGVIYTNGAGRWTQITLPPSVHSWLGVEVGQRRR